MPTAPPSSSADSYGLHRRGLVLTALGGFLLTFDVPLLRLADSEPWTVMFWRGWMVFAVLLAFWLIRRVWRNDTTPFVNGRQGLIVGLLYGAGNITFIFSLFNTTAANLVFILAFNPMFSAILSKLFLGEKIPVSTWIAILCALGGVVIIVWDGIGQGSFFGDAMALTTALILACALTISRSSGLDLSLTPAVAGLTSALIASAFAAPLSLSLAQAGWLGVNGFIVMPLALALLALGPRYLTAPEVAMFYLLETVITPFWVWLILAEVPSKGSLIGGAIVIAALLAHSLWRLGVSRRQASWPQPL